VTEASPDAAKYLWDARRAADRIARFTVGRTFDDYLGYDMLRAAVERQFEIVGEAFAGLRRVNPALAAGVPDLSRIVAFAMCSSTATRPWTTNWFGVWCRASCPRC